MNIKRIIAGLMVVCVMGAALPSAYGKTADNAVITATAYTEGVLSYAKYSDYITITGCDESATSVVIPDEIDGVPVTRIGAWAFKDCTSLIEITISDNVTSIEQAAFIACSKLKSITILNPACDIYDDQWTFAGNALLGGDGNYHLIGIGDYFYGYSGTIYGYENSTARAYAEKYDCTFKSLGKAPEKAPEKSPEMGDIDGDGKIDSSDASLVLSEYSLLSTGKNGNFSESQKKLADLNKDGKIDSSDASLILAYYSYVSTDGTDSIEDFLAKQGY